MSGFIFSDFTFVQGAKGCMGEMGDMIAFGETGVVAGVFAVVPVGAIAAVDIVGFEAKDDGCTDFLQFLGTSLFSTTATVTEVFAGAGDPSFFLCFFFFLVPLDFPSLHRTCTKSNEKKKAVFLNRCKK